jgi:uncharacterized protein (TIGR02271 family)
MVTMAELRDGMKVRSSDGHDLGKIIRLDSGLLVIEKGFFFPKDYEVPLSMVSDIRDGEAILSVSKEALEREGSAAELGATSRGRETGWTGEAERSAFPAGATEETRVQLAEEELQAEKRTRDAGEVRVRKEVVTEHKTIDVPVTREEVHVERVPISTSDTTVGRDAFDEKTIVVPVREEEVRVTKRPRVREEVRVSKSSKTVEQRADADVRREEARIERTDDEGDRGGLLGRSDEERTTGYGVGERDDRGGILGLGRDDDPTKR